MPTELDTGFGTIISFDWFPDPNVIAARIMSLARYLENFVPPLEASKAIAKADMQNHFDTETSPGGAPWAPLADETIERWGEHSILQLTGAMHGAAVSDSAYMVDGHDLYIDTSGFPDYWVFHEFGRQSPQMHIFKEMIAAGHKLGLGYKYSGGGMPPRPFVGISEKAEAEIIAVFDAWFEGGVIGFVGGTAQPRMTSGQFGKKIVPS